MGTLITDNIQRIHHDQIGSKEFIELFEKRSRPVIIQGVADNWPGLKEWQINRLLERFGNSRFKIGESDSGRKLRVTMK